MNSLVSGIIASLTTATALGAAIVWFSGKATEKTLDVIVARIQKDLNVAENRRNLLVKSSLDFKSQQLNEFYWPIYSRLQKDNAVWNRILDKRSSDERLKNIAKEIESRVVLPNHDEIVQIIQTKIHLAQASPELQKALMQYVRHVAVYRAMRAAGDDDRFPIALGEVWPDELFVLVERKTKQLQGELDIMLAKALKDGE
ncbi:hypothetical protein ABS772_06380 [Methylorubrum podarium]|uniref:Uncharacterized protein n=1 Tax=Methylorubrum podarium TaxID=200476 RepID=A0ABV1QJG9_9HYPH